MGFSNLRAKRVINAFKNCVTSGVYTYDYAITLIENTEKYGYLTEGDKEQFYLGFEGSEAVTNEDN